jgi:hypothetical protein
MNIVWAFLQSDVMDALIILAIALGMAGLAILILFAKKKI